VKVSGNGASLVLLIGDRWGSILLAADLEREQENALMILEKDLDATVLQVGHHGSTTSSSLSFLGKIAPEWAVIPVGENPWGHPHPDVLDRIIHVLGDSSHVLRTDGPERIRFGLTVGFGVARLSGIEP
jgi:competence protein ComEC